MTALELQIKSSWFAQGITISIIDNPDPEVYHPAVSRSIPFVYSPSIFPLTGLSYWSKFNIEINRVLICSCSDYKERQPMASE